MLVLTSVLVKIIGAIYKIPLTAYIGAVGRGYFAVAYNLYLPIFAIALGAFPVALSRLVSKYNTNENSFMLLSMKKSARRVFLLVGLIGTIIMLAVAKPYSQYIASSPKSLLTIVVLSPCILFASLTASINDYYKGLMNMVPTAISQAIDALFKMVFGLLLARASMHYFYCEYQQLGTVLGKAVYSESDALALIYPLTSAFAMLGACLGSFSGLAFSSVYDFIHRKKKGDYKSLDVKSAQRELLSFSFPIMISCAVQSVFQFLDTASIQFALGMVDEATLLNSFANSDVNTNDVVAYSYGIFSTALDFRNLIVGITMSLGVCAVPAISREFELNDKDKLSSLVNSIYKYTTLLSLLGGVLLSLYAHEILSLFYSSSQDIVNGCEDLVRFFGFSVVFYSLSGTAVNAVQAVGCPEKSIKPYIISGLIRVALNILLIKNEAFLLNGAVISGAVGYLVMCVWNLVIVKKMGKISFDFKEVVAKPVIITVITFYVSVNVYNYIDASCSAVINLLIKISVSSLIFCILCFSLKSLKLSSFFLHQKSKRMA